MRLLCANKEYFTLLFTLVCVCLSTKKITQNVVDGFSWNLMGSLSMTQRRPDYILGLLRIYTINCFQFLKHWETRRFKH